MSDRVHKLDGSMASPPTPEATPKGTRPVFLPSDLDPTVFDEGFLRRAEGEAHEQDGIRVIAAGPNAFLYVLDAGAPLDADRRLLPPADR
jgi:hypothetical protein